MKKHLFYLIFLSLYLNNKLTAQHQIADTLKGKAVIYFEEKNVIVYLDSQKILPSKKPKLLPCGKHVVKTWAPHFKLRIDTITISGSKTLLLAKRLSHTEEYNIYKHNLINYRFGKILFRSPYLAGAVGSLVMAYYYSKNKTNMDKTYQKAIENKDAYNTYTFIASEVAMYKERYETNKIEYEKLRTQNNNLAITAAIVVPLTIAWCFVTEKYLVSKLKKPYYNEHPLLSSLNLKWGMDYTCGSVGTSLKLSLKL